MQTRPARPAAPHPRRAHRSTGRFLGLSALPFLALVSASQSAFAYEFFQYFGNPLRWADQNPATPATLDIYYDFRAIGSFTNEVSLVQKALYEQALADWSSVTSGRLVFTLNTTRPTDQILNLSVGDLAALNGTSTPGGTLGIGSPSFTGNGTIVSAAVQLDNTEPWDLFVGNGNAPPVSGSLPPDFYSVAIHEVGHALGLDHEDLPFSNLMASSYRGEKLGPAADDILGMSTLYSATPNYTAVNRTLTSFNVSFPPGNFNYFEGNPSVFSQWVDSGNTTITGTTQVQDGGSFHHLGGTWTTNNLVIGGAVKTGLLEISGGSFTTSSATINIGTLSLAGGLLQARTVDFAGGTTFNWTGGTLSLTPGATPPTLSGLPNLIVPTAGVLKTAGSHILNSLTINGQAQLLPNHATKTATKVNTLTIAGAPNAWTGRLDLTTSALIVQTTGDKLVTLATLLDQVESGRNGGAWNGPGITSSTVASSPGTSLALVDNAHLGLTSFRGITGLNADSLIITQAQNGDATLDDIVDAFDLNIVAANWQQGAGLWSSGDFTGDGIVDAFDLNVLAANWQFGTGGSLAAALAAYPVLISAQVPEPATLSVLGVAALTLLKRRRPVHRAR